MASRTRWFDRWLILARIYPFRCGQCARRYHAHVNGEQRRIARADSSPAGHESGIN
jgi:hypothetical protein